MLVTLYYQDWEFWFENWNRLWELWDDAKLQEVCSRIYKELEWNKQLIRDLLNKD